MVAQTNELASSVNIRIATPDGVMYVTVTEDGNHNPVQVNVSAGKCGHSFSAWAVSMCEVISYMLSKTKTPIATVIHLLSEHNSDREVNHGSLRVKSGVQGIKLALIQYLQYKKQNSDGLNGFAPRI